MLKIRNYINDKFISPVSRKYFGNYNPATGKIFSLVPDSDDRDIEMAVKAAAGAFPGWSATPKEKRSEILLSLSRLIEKNSEPFAFSEMEDTGKPLWLTRSLDIPRAVANFHFYGTAILHFSSESHIMEDDVVNYTRRDPIGIAGCISPWNLPLYLFTWKIAPALAAGNCVIGKPSELTPVTAYMLAALCNEAGLPPGVLNIVHGYGYKAGAAIASHPEIPLISFTGGTKTGSEIAKAAAPFFKKLSLELGGKNPVLIFSDCNFDNAVETTVRSSFLNQGEICLCGSRIFVEKIIYEKFRSAFVAKIKNIKAGDPKDKENFMGAVISKKHLDKITGYIELARREGGKILCGGTQKKFEGKFKNGWFIEPSVIEGLSYSCRVNREEIFGPVVSLIPFDDEREAVSMANSADYGLASVIWTENIGRATRVARQLQSGVVWINCWLLRDLRTPFGGMKQSGLGREGGAEALRFFTEPKNVCMKA